MKPEPGRAKSPAGVPIVESESITLTDLAARLQVIHDGIDLIHRELFARARAEQAAAISLAALADSFVVCAWHPIMSACHLLGALAEAEQAEVA